MTTDLRPMTIGEILDRTFNIYRHNFQLFLGIGVVPAALWFLCSAGFVLVTTLQPRSHGGFSTAAVVVSSLTIIVGGLIYVGCICISHGAVAYAVSAIYLGRTTSLSESYGRIRGRFLRIINVAISVGVRVFGTFVLIIATCFAVALLPGMRETQMLTAVLGLVWIVAFVVALWLLIRMSTRYALSVPACVLEDLPARKAMRRSISLSRGSLRRIFTVYLLFSIVNGAFSFAVKMPFQVATVTAKSQMARVILALGNDLSSSILLAVVGPLATIAITLLYYDERVRKEAFDVHYMMETLDGPLPDQASSAAAAAGPLPA